jgi:hypothetical protein
MIGSATQVMLSMLFHDTVGQNSIDITEVNRSHGYPRGMSSVRINPVQEKSDSIGFLRNKNAALPARAQKSPLTLSGLKKNGSRMAPAATNFRAPSECHGYRRTG